MHGAVREAPLVTVVIVNYNSGACLARCIAALARQSWREFDVLIVDNGSADESLHALDELPASWQAIRLGYNAGFAAANNLALRRTEAPWVALLNPDAFPETDWLEQLLAGTERYPDAAAFGSLQIDAARPDRLDGAGDACHVSGIYWRGGSGQSIARQRGEGEVTSVCAAAALYRREAVLAQGGFDEDFFCYGEDVDLGLRLWRAGYRSIQLADAAVRHVGGASGGRRSDFAVYHGRRNRLWLYVKNMPPALFWPLLPAHLLATAADLPRFWLSGNLRALGRALVDGLRGLPGVWRKRRMLQALPRGPRRAPLCWSPLAALQRRPIVRPVAMRCRLQRATGAGGVGIAMVSYRTGPVLLEAVEAALADPAVERLVVVDNGNAPELAAALAARAAAEPRLLVLAGQGNVGFAAGCNLAARQIGSDYLLLLNPDCLLPSGGAALLREELRRLTRPALLGGLMVGADGQIQRASRRRLPTIANLVGEALRLDRLLPGWPRIEIEAPLPLDTSPVPAISGAAMFLTRKNYWALGGLDPGYFLHVEDLDLCARFQAAGGEVCLVPTLQLRHERSSSAVSRVTVERHKMRGFRRYFLKMGRPAWERTLLAAMAAAWLAFLAIASGPAARRRGSGSGSGAASALPDRF
jgi:N-acetylglucosaminyl-diphospho-decaprenol L-rhamnosyltransferase